MSRLLRLARSGPAQRLLRSGPARRLTTQLVAAQRTPEDVSGPYAAWVELERTGPVPLSGGAATADGERTGAMRLESPAAASGGPLRIGFVVPEFRRGSGGHTTIANLVRGLETRGHTCSVWIHDPLGRAGGAAAFRAFFGPFAASVHDGLAGWGGADVAVATGWQSVAPVLLLPGCRGRAHLVQDEEPEFYPASAERLWAERAFVLPAITAGTWLAERMRERGLRATPFDLGIDHAVYRPHPAMPRAPGRVLFYARLATPRRAVPLGLLALAALHRRRPDVEIVLYGDATPLTAPFPFTNLGILDPPDVARTYAEATVGLVLSLTNHSLAAQEMLACGLPVVELRTPSTEAAFGDSPIVLAEPSVLALADALERLLRDPEERRERAGAGVRWAASRTWPPAAAAVEAGLRAALDAAGRDQAA
ncbi:MAG TPA: glycosyltransferase family 4 protein [Solirubrobacteraceae bacterium]|nr:glycosyltransferase family 4 protein [Solirubrobacteraceae bacterium]